ncbi:MAG: acyl carrier protein [Terracidiphilus sp.]
MGDIDSVLGKVQEAFATSFDVDPKSVTIETGPSDIPGWDSVGHLSLASNLEQAFEINLDVDELIEMENVREIVRIVSSKIQKNN